MQRDEAPAEFVSELLAFGLMASVHGGGTGARPFSTGPFYSRPQVQPAVTMAIRQWSARGGPTVLGKVVPAVIACVGLLALGENVVILEEHGWQSSSAPSAFLVFMALLTAWLVWRFLRTAWLIVLADDTFTCYATARRWTLGPGEINAVKGDVYSQFLQIVGGRDRIMVWGHLDDRQSLFAAIRRANPAVEFAPSLRQSFE